MIEIASFCMQGKNKLNQDAVLHLKSDDVYLFAIADGMGGELGGSLASSLSLNTVEELFLKNKDISIKEIFEKVSNQLKSLSELVPKYEKMATTLTICIVKNNIGYVGHVGDCRIYHLRDEGIMRRTKDQTEVQKLLDDKILTKSLAKNYHRKNVLLSVMSNAIEYQLQESTFELISKDRLLLLSDGVYNVIDNKIIIRDISLSNHNIKDFSVNLQKEIESRKVKDDYSCISIQFN
ncbi:MAG: protein phosphatase 2C domain-containing protein [Sulfurimonas sp.]